MRGVVTKRSLLLVLLACVPSATSWAQTVNVTYSNAAVVSNTTVIATDADPANVINLPSGYITVDGNDIFGVTANSLLRIAVNAAGTRIQPSLPSSGLGYGTLSLWADRGGKITVDVLGDLTFTGTNSNAAGTSKNDLTLTFSGQGVVQFNITNLKSVVFTGQYFDGVSYQETNDNAGAGVHAYIVMDQTNLDAVEAGVNKVVFARTLYANWDATNILTQGDVNVRINHNSFITYVSDNKTGLDPASSQGITAGETKALRYGSLAFDVSNPGVGRMLLWLKGTATPSLYRDGSLNVQGYLLGNGTGGVGDITHPNDFRLNVQFNQAAGAQAIFRVTDEKAFTYTDYSFTLTTAQAAYLLGGDGIARDSSNVPNSRGLVIINTCNSEPAFAADPYDDGGWFNQDIFNSGRGNTPIRPGFVVGVNGLVDVYHNTFLNHISGTNTRALSPSAVGLTGLNTALTTASVAANDTFKKHGPSAMLVDGLPSAATYGTLYQAHEILGTKASISLRGWSKLFCTSAVTNGGVFNSATLNLGNFAYNGTTAFASTATVGEGEVVLDIEDQCTLYSFIDNFNSNTLTSTVPFARHNGSLFGQYAGTTPLDGGLGELNIPSVQIGHTGWEVDGSGAIVLQRPLIINHSYPRCNNGSILLNGDLTIRWAALNHNDVGRTIGRDALGLVGDPVNAASVISGGERVVFGSLVHSTAEELPVIWLENATIDCHESIAVSGLRMVVQERLDLTQTLTSNSSTIVFFNRGDLYDLNNTGLGRIFQLGTQGNKLANGLSNATLSNGFVNVFKHAASLTNVAELLFDAQPDLGIAHTDEKIYHTFLLGNNSYTELGWTSTQGVIANASSVVVFPWDAIDNLPNNPTDFTIFSLDKANNQPATLEVIGDLIYFDARDGSENQSPLSVGDPRLGRVMYVNYGGRFKLSQELNSTTGAVTFAPRAEVNQTIAFRVPTIDNADDPAGVIDAPRDQVTYTKPVVPYNINLQDAFVNDTNVDLTKVGLDSSVDTFYLNWSDIPRVTGFVPVKSYRGLLEMSRHYYKDALTRAIAIQIGAVAMPAGGLLQLGSGQLIQQFQVSGATQANPLLLYLTGDTTDRAVIREMVSVPTLPLVIGEGQNAAIFMDRDAKIGLGSRDFNAESVNAWNLLGKEYVTLLPNGNATVELNSDLIIADAQPVIPTANFGLATTNRLTFFAENSHEIRIPAGGELDLSAFGSAPIGEQQQLAFAGRVRLIFEAGSTLRFPDLKHSGVAQRPILYLTDDAELIWEGTGERDATRLAARNISDPVKSNIDVRRSRIIGVGEIRIDKHARMRIASTSVLGLETDNKTDETDILISVMREGAMLIGDLNTAGGVFQVGNVVNRAGHAIYLLLRVDGPKSVVQVSREGFIGFGAGLKQRASTDTGTTAVNGSTVRSLFNVADIDIRSIRGAVSHNQVYAGSDPESSLMALGPATSYTVDLGISSESIWRGGGNLLYVTDTATDSAPITVAIASTATPLLDEYNRDALGAIVSNNAVNRAANNGKYTIMGSGVITRQITSLGTEIGAATLLESIDSTYQATINETASPNLLGGKHFTGDQKDMFNYLGFTEFKSQTPAKFVVLGATQFEYKVGLVNGTEIIRTTSIPFLDKTESSDGAARIGALLAATVDASGNPAAYALPQPPLSPNVTLIES